MCTLCNPGTFVRLHAFCAPGDRQWETTLRQPSRFLNHQNSTRRHLLRPRSIHATVVSQHLLDAQWASSTIRYPEVSSRLTCLSRQAPSLRVGFCLWKFPIIFFISPLLRNFGRPLPLGLLRFAVVKGGIPLTFVLIALHPPVLLELFHCPCQG